MAYVTVPKDLDRVKNKVVFNLTVRQVICLGIAAMIGAPFYFATRNILGVSNAATGMVILMLPVFFFALYEKDGLPLEKVLMNMANVKFIRPAERKCRRLDKGETRTAKKKNHRPDEKLYRQKISEYQTGDSSETEDSMVLEEDIVDGITAAVPDDRPEEEVAELIPAINIEEWISKETTMVADEADIGCRGDVQADDAKTEQLVLQESPMTQEAYLDSLLKNMGGGEPKR